MTSLQHTFASLTHAVQQKRVEPVRKSTPARRSQAAKLKAQREERKAEALRLVREQPGIATDKIAAHFGVNNTTASAYMRELKREGRLVGKQGKHNTMERFYEADT